MLVLWNFPCCFPCRAASDPASTVAVRMLQLSRELGKELTWYLLIKE